MKTFINLLYSIAALLFIGVVGYFIFKVIKYLISNLDKVNANLFVGILGATVTLTGYFITRYFERKKMIEIEIRNKKIPVYEEFVNFYFKLINSKDQKEPEDDFIVNFFQNFNQKAIVWFPDDILKSYISWRRNLVSYNLDKRNLRSVILDQEDFMKKIREDIGHENKNIGEYEISSLYINDIEKFKKENQQI